MFKNNIFKNIGIYTLLNFINSAIPFLLLPFLTNVLSKEEYGVVDLFNNTGLILFPIVGLNIVSSVIRFYYDKEIEVKELLSTSVNFILISSLGSFVLSIIICSFFNINETVQIIFFCALFYSCFSQVTEILLAYYRAKELPLKFGLLRICKTSCDFGLTVLILLYVYQGWESRVFTAVAIAFIYCFISVFLMIKDHNYTFSINYNLLKKCLVFSSPLIIHSISGYLLGYADRFIILKNLDLGAVGVYSIAYQIGMIMSFVSNSINQAWTPVFFRELSNNNIESFKKVRKYNNYFALGMIIIGLFLFAFVPLIYKYMIGKDFVLDYSIVGFIIMAYIFNGIYKFEVNYFFYYKRTFLLSILTLICAIFNIFLCWFLVPSMGLLGAAISASIGFFVQLLFVYVVKFYVKR